MMLSSSSSNHFPNFQHLTSSVSSNRTIGNFSAAFFLLLIGGAIYVLMRPPFLLIHQVTWDLGYGVVVQNGRMLVAGLKVPNWFLYSLPGTLWATAWILIIDDLLHNSVPLRRLLVAAFIPVLGIGSELLQFIGLLPGTFDVIDAVAYALPYLIYIIVETLRSPDLKTSES